VGGGAECRKLAVRYLSIFSPALHSLYAFFYLHFLYTVLVCFTSATDNDKMQVFLKAERKMFRLK